MILFKILILIYSANIVLGYPTDADDNDVYPEGYRQLTPEQSKRLAEWTEDSKEDYWTLSGQFQGDMILSPEQKNGLFEPKYRWPNNTVPYALSPDFTQAEKAEIVRAILEIPKVTCLKLKYVSTEPSYVLIRSKASGCFSNVGYRGKPMQYINLGKPNCLRPGTIQHEFLHTLGFHHMQSDSDRDDYVHINTQNILAGYEDNFEKYNDSFVTKFGEEYDYGSIMHYGRYAFSNNGDETITPTKDPNAWIGQRVSLSDSDIAKINKMYNCP